MTYAPAAFFGNGCPVYGSMMVAVALLVNSDGRKMPFSSFAVGIKPVSDLCERMRMPS